MEAAEAYARCEAIARARAANFYFGIRLLPGPKRRALCAVYALSRRIDDIGDGMLSSDEKLVGLEAVREDLGRIGTERDDPALVAMAHAARAFPIPLTAFHELVDGVEMDVRETRYETIDDLVVYCRRVAGTIGRLSLSVFGSSDSAAAAPLADDLGVALQLTNILRDVREDHLSGRLYLPQADLRSFGCRLAIEPPHDPKLLQLIRFEADRADGWFGRGFELLPLLQGRSLACAAAMAGIYRRILTRIERRPEVVLERRVSLPTWEKVLVAMRCLARAVL